MGISIYVQKLLQVLNKKATSMEHTAPNSVQKTSALMRFICSKTEPNRAVPDHEGRWTGGWDPMAQTTIPDRGTANKGLTLGVADYRHGVALLFQAGFRAPLSSPKALGARALHGALAPTFCVYLIYTVNIKLPFR